MDHDDNDTSVGRGNKCDKCNSNDTSDGRGNKGDSKCYSNNTSEGPRNKGGAKCDGNNTDGRGNKGDSKCYGDITSEGRGNKGGGKCNSNNTSDDRGNKGDPKCDSDVMSNGRRNKGDGKCNGNENGDRDCDGDGNQGDKVWQSPTRNVFSLGPISQTPVFSPFCHHSEEVSPVAPQQLSQEIDAAAGISHHDKSSTSGKVDLLLQNPLSRSEVIRQLLSNTTFHQEVQSGLELLQPPIVSNTAYNNQKVNWSGCMHSYHIDERAFSAYSQGPRMGQRRHADNKISEYKECTRAKRRVLDALLKSGSFEQQQLTLLNVFSDLLVVNITSSIGINMAEISSLQQFIVNIKKMFSRSRTTTNKNYRTSKAQTYL